MAEQVAIPTIELSVQDSRKVGEDIRVVVAKVQLLVTATDEDIAAVTEAMNKMAAQFPLPEQPDNVGRWYNDAFFSAFMRAFADAEGGAHKTLFRFMRRICSPEDMGGLIVGTKQHPTETIAQVSEVDNQYLDWIETKADNWRLKIAVMVWRGRTWPED